MTAKRPKKIGVFDSGMGGLTVLKEILRVLPDCETVYFGDVARVPYGSRSRETILKYALQDVRFLLSQGVDTIVIACGTVSANALEPLRQTFSVPIYGVVEPAAREAVAETRCGRIGILGTIATVRSGKYEQVIHDCDPAIRTLSVECPLLVPIIEGGLSRRDPITEMVCRRYLAPLQAFAPDTVIMGCTHYPYLTETFREMMPGVRFILVGQTMAAMLGKMLPPPESEPSAPSKVTFYASGDNASNSWLLGEMYGGSIADSQIHLIDIETY